MKCTKCGSPTHVLMTYNNADNSIRRRRECRAPKCQFRFTTREKVEHGHKTNAK